MILAWTLASRAIRLSMMQFLTCRRVNNPTLPDLVVVDDVLLLLLHHEVSSRGLQVPHPGEEGGHPGLPELPGGARPQARVLLQEAAQVTERLQPGGGWSGEPGHLREKLESGSNLRMAAVTGNLAKLRMV